MYQEHIIIIGAGIVGLSTAFALLRQGVKRVTVLEQATVDHERSTSHGLSRLLRFEYGKDIIYTQMVQMALKHWKGLERFTKRTLYTQTGVVTLGNENDNETRQSYYTLREQGFSPERLTRRTCAQRFPQFDTTEYDFIMYNLEAGMLQASVCLQTLRECILDMGGTILEHHRVVTLLHESRQQPIRLVLEHGESLTADRVVVATGPWVHHLLEDLQLPVRLTRQYLLYFSHLSSTRFGLYAFPAFMAGKLYGFPLHNTCTGSGPGWLKAASHEFGAPVNVDEVPSIDVGVIKQVTTALYNLLPDLQQAELAHVDTCIYDVSPDGNFIIDYLKDDRRIVFATGLTGHAFKFGLLLGEVLSAMVREVEPVIPLERFQLARFAAQWQVQQNSVA